MKTKTKKFLRMVGVCAVMAGFSARAAIQEFTVYQNPSSPEYADFAAQSLNVNYSYSGGTGTFTAVSQTEPTASMSYQAGSQAAGTGGAYVTSKQFTGYYSLSATIQDVSGNWEVTGGTLDVYGNLLTGQTVPSGQTGDLLLSVNLMNGLNTINAGVGTGSKEFDFRLGSVTGGSSAIMQDFLGVANGSGYIDLNVGTYAQAFTDLSHNFSGLSGKGFADTFVPEPSLYAGVSSFMALIGFISASRKNRRKASVF
jgi:hypothetical protein